MAPEKVKFWAGVAVMAFYVLDCIAQNEIFQALERGGGDGTTTCSGNHTGNHTDNLAAAAAAAATALRLQPGLTGAGGQWVYGDAAPAAGRGDASGGWDDDDPEVEVTTMLGNNSANCTVHKGHPKFNKPFFIVWWNHCFIIWILFPVLTYLAIAAPLPTDTAAGRRRGGGGGGEGGEGGEKEALLGVDSINYSPDDGAGAGKVTQQGAAALGRGGPPPYGRYPPRPPPGFARVTWYLQCHNFSWYRLCTTGLWAGFLFLCFNYLWYVGLPMPGMLPSEASAAANSSFAWIYIMSLFMLDEKLDMIKVAAVVACIAGVVLLAVASYEESVDDSASSKNGTGPDGHHGSFHLSTGILVEFLCAIGQALYFVVYRKYALRGGKVNWQISALIAGFEGLAHLTVFWVFFIVLDLTGYETFEWPNTYQLQTLALGASITSTGCISIMVGLALLPNPLIVSVASLLNTPGQFIADILLHPSAVRSMGPFDIAGGALVVVASGVVIARDSWLLSNPRPKHA